MNGFRLVCGSALVVAGVVWSAGAPAEAAPRAAAPRRSAAVKPAAKAAPVPALSGVTRVEIAPASFTLDGPRSEQRLVVLATTRDGATHDVTDRATLSVSDPKLARRSSGVLVPVADGKLRLVAKLGALSSAPAVVTVQNAKTPAPYEFVNDIAPILAKAGCNSTACHGSPAGKGGFKLSLFGYEPELDHPAIVKDAEGKRVNLKDPAQSLILTKAVMAVPHAGGQRFKVGSPEYRTILEWLKEGASGIGEFEARVRSVQVIPDQPWMPAVATKQRLVVTAQMSDGSTRDVTEKALFSSNDDAIADVDGRGIVTSKRSGETAVMIRFLGQVAVSRVAVLPSHKLESYPKLPQNNYVDQLVQAKLRKLRMVPSDLCTDEEFIRRAMLDVCGIIPTTAEVRAFTEDRTPNKRAKLIDTLLERPEFVDLWTMRWNDTLRNNARVTRLGVGAYAGWIRRQIAQNRPYNEFVRDLVTASGKNSDVTLDPENLPRQLQNAGRRAQGLVQILNNARFNAPANYFLVSRDPLDVTSATSQVFMGVRIECARCHNHPFEKWTQTDYYGLAAFFTGLRVVGPNQAPQLVTFNSSARGPRHPKTNEVVEPRTLDDAEVKLAAGEDKRAVLADWITSPTNPYFSRALVNRLWGHYFGRGIVEPVDDFRVTNPASNPELLDALAKDFVDRKFDVKHMHRVILNSRTYQQSSRPNQYNRDDTSNFARYYPKRMMAEQLYDSISQATGIFLPDVGRAGRRRAAAVGGQAGMIAGALQDGMPEGPVTRVMQIPVLTQGLQGQRRGPGDLAQFLDTFGKPRREAVCECERSPEGNMGQALTLINGNEINAKIAAPFGRVQQLVRSEKAAPEVIEELYLAVLSRKPTAAEVKEATALISSSSSRKEGIEDLTWSLLNAREFLFIH